MQNTPNLHYSFSFRQISHFIRAKDMSRPCHRSYTQLEVRQTVSLPLSQIQKTTCFRPISCHFRQNSTFKSDQVVSIGATFAMLTLIRSSGTLTWGNLRVCFRIWPIRISKGKIWSALATRSLWNCSDLVNFQLSTWYIRRTTLKHWLRV